MLADTYKAIPVYKTGLKASLLFFKSLMVLQSKNVDKKLINTKVNTGYHTLIPICIFPSKKNIYSPVQTLYKGSAFS